MIDLQTAKWTAATVLVFLGALTGFISLHIANRYHRLLGISDALANGIFVGAGFFHLFPEALSSMEQYYHSFPAGLLLTLIVSISALLCLILVERYAKQQKALYKTQHILLLIFILTVHAFIAGSALGLTQTHALFLSLFFAIMAHKAFALFALVIYLFHRKLQTKYIRLIFLFFSLVTPLGIVFGTYLHHIANLHIDSLFRAYFNALSAGIFLYIGCLRHTLQSPYLLDGHQRYTRYLVTLLGVTCMAVLALWI